MRKLLQLFMAACLSTAFMVSASAQSADEIKRQTISTSYLLSFGKLPSQAETNYWMGQNLSGDVLKNLVENHRNYLQGNPSLKKDMIRRSFKNVYGRTPSESEVNQNMSQNYNYSDWIKNHMAWLRKSGTDYENVIKFAYQNVMGRQSYANEVSYWKNNGATAYYLLAACVDNCKRTSGSGACAKNVVGNGLLDQIKVADVVAKQTASLIGQAGGNVISAGGGNVVSAGGGNVVSAAGGN